MEYERGCYINRGHDYLGQRLVKQSSANPGHQVAITLGTFWATKKSGRGTEKEQWENF